MTQPHKTLAECKDEVARKYQRLVEKKYVDWNEMEAVLWNEGSEASRYTLMQRINEAYELHASQLIKKGESINLKAISNKVDSVLENSTHDELKSFVSKKNETVSSDVEQAAQDSAGGLTNEGTTFERYEHIEGFKSGAKWQSKQQPATINFLSEEEIRGIATKHSVIYLAKFGAAYDALNELQDKLKERVNCVDPMEFIQWAANNQFTMRENVWTSTKIHYSGCAYAPEQLLELYIDYLKTNPNGQK